MNVHERLAALGAAVPTLLIPREGTDLKKWAVIACDQYTRDPSYWERVRNEAGDSPSTLDIIFPEVYLEEKNRGERIEAIRAAMKQFLAECPVEKGRFSDTAEYGANGGFFSRLEGFMYVERDTPCRAGRRGLVLALDMECYDWRDGAQTLIRSTEGTVPERILARMEIRRGAPLESPHIMALLDDSENFLLPGLGERARRGAARYDTELMLGAGRARGWLLDREDDWEFLAGGLETLRRRSPFLYAMGDGNHSLAAAKAVWDEYKTKHAGEAGLENHPARWVLVELENLYDPALSFEPIHRALFGASLDEISEALKPLAGFSRRDLGTGEAARREAVELAAREDPCLTRYILVSGGRCVALETKPAALAVEPLQNLLDGFLQNHPAVSIDYLHGAGEVFRVAEGIDAVGILLPPFRKEGLFETVARRGALPRKSFSMGESDEKRFYLECRKLFG
ncbi:MAG: DUF1015 domain-containing protein [Treponema sp.]|jgi:hypothetical protein|nr:DUF1015 domain-containing protein [Treponema sp.]